MANFTKRLVVGVVLGFMFGFGSAWIWIDRNTSGIAGDIAEDLDKEDPEENIEDGIPTESETSVNNFSDILIINNQPAGAKVIVDKAVFEDYGWVVIYEDEAGEPGNILGAQLFDPLIGTSGHVELLRSTFAGNSYYAILQLDNGNRQFDYQDDLVLRDSESGKIIITKFKTF